jgi:hypothetical protein
MTGTGSAGTGTVWEKRTHGLPVRNPTCAQPTARDDLKCKVQVNPCSSRPPQFPTIGLGGCFSAIDGVVVIDIHCTRGVCSVGCEIAQSHCLCWCSEEKAKWVGLRWCGLLISVFQTEDGEREQVLGSEITVQVRVVSCSVSLLVCVKQDIYSGLRSKVCAACD